MEKRIQTFQFLISNYVGNEVFNTTIGRRDINGRKEEESYEFPQCRKGTVLDSSQIDTYINGFLKGKQVVDIKVDTYTIHHHNNSYCDSVVARYTIIYNVD